MQHRGRCDNALREGGGVFGLAGPPAPQPTGRPTTHRCLCLAPQIIRLPSTAADGGSCRKHSRCYPPGARRPPAYIAADATTRCTPASAQRSARLGWRKRAGKTRHLLVARASYDEATSPPSCDDASNYSQGGRYHNFLDTLRDQNCIRYSNLDSCAVNRVCI